ncbi:MAG: SulP family inorganic anion transporter [Mariprofundales bacterium]|nr:SulP family inorganic anion transporter [Mariprofundales bacterium]
MSPAPITANARPTMGDLWGSISAATLVLPQAMAFGIALWLPIHGNSGAAALAGLITAAMLSLASGAMRGTCGMVSAPTGPTLVLISAAAATYQSHGVAPELMATALLLTVALAGLLQMGIGLLNLGQIIKFIPYPVVSGFMTGTGILMILSQRHALLPEGIDDNWIPLVTAIATIVTMHWLPRLLSRLLPEGFPKPPPTILGLICGTLLFHLLVLTTGIGLPTSWVVGTLPALSDAHFGIDIDHILQLPLTLVLLSALALAVLASLDTLLTAVIADVTTGQRHDARRELAAQGGGQMLSAMLGGMAGAGTTGATLVAIESGGRQWSGLLTGLVFLLLIVVMAPIAAWLPISVFAGIIIHVSLFSMLDLEIVQWIKSRRTRLDATIALTVIGVTVYYNLMVAVGLGVALSVVEFLRAQVDSSVIHRRWTLGERPSMRHRPPEEREAIASHADLAAGYDLQGSLFFGSADSLFSAISHSPAKFVILSLRRVLQIDLTAIRMIGQIAGTLRQHGGELVLTHASGRMGLTRCQNRTHYRVIPYHSGDVIPSFSQTEAAIEYVENRLLEEQGLIPAHQIGPCPPRQAKLFRDLSDRQFGHLEPWLTPHHASAGDYLFRCGDAGNSLLIVVHGELEALLPYRKKRRMRLATVGPGMEVGEAAFLNPAPRKTDLRAISDAQWVELSHDDLMRIADHHPRVALRLVQILAQDLGARMANVDAIVQRLAE